MKKRWTYYEQNYGKLNLSDNYDKFFPKKTINEKSLEEIKRYLIQIRIKHINDFEYPNPECDCDKNCKYLNIAKILKKTNHEVEMSGYDPYWYIGRCWKLHHCFMLCDGCFKSGNTSKCLFTGRIYNIPTEYEYEKTTNNRGKKWEIEKKDKTMDLLHSKRNIDMKINISKKVKEKVLFKWDGFVKKKERKVTAENANLKFDINEIIDLIKKLTFNKSFSEYENKIENIQFYILSQGLNHFFRNITKEQMYISLGLLSVHSILTSPNLKDLFGDIPESDLDIIKIFEDKMLRLLPGFFRLQKEKINMINIQKKQYAQAKKYLTDRCRLRKIVPYYLDLYIILYFDNKWFGDKLTMFLTFQEWIEILLQSLIIWKLCKLCGDDKNVVPKSIEPDDLIVSILNLLADGWKYNNTMVIERNLILSEQFYYLRLNSFSCYGINPKIHKKGMEILNSSLKYLCRVCGVKMISDFIKGEEVDY
jgi:hypothetical protein